MRNPTIWESASRPLYVRSVWLEATTTRRGQQRHFILDYEQRQEQRLKLSGQTTNSKRSNTIEQSSSFEFSDFDANSDSCEELCLLGSAKVKFQQQRQCNQHRRLSTRKNHSLKASHRRFNAELLPDIQSRRSSLQDLQSTLSNPNPEERLAERVLNWLDLAGKTPSFLQVLDNAKIVKMPTGTVTTQRNQRNSKQCQRAAATLTPQRPLTTRKHNSGATRQPLSDSTMLPRPESVKHITIIFNKEGVPVRLNRPARNIDLCAFASSPGAVRRLAGPMASARLYEGDNSAGYSSSRRGNLTSNNLLPGVSQGTLRKQRGWETPPYGSSAKAKTQHFYEDAKTFHDSKKQLHIFMPSLPKKGSLSTTMGSGGEDIASVLSNTFSELCRT